MDWQPIETAPKMREIILWADTSTPEFSNWKMASGFFHDGMEVWIWGGEQVREWAFPPTHWTPLPPPPSPMTDLQRLGQEFDGAQEENQ